eukprot:scaffold77054_cov62-Phaeocystis_antarctica.AAC.1
MEPCRKRSGPRPKLPPTKAASPPWYAWCSPDAAAQAAADARLQLDETLDLVVHLGVVLARARHARRGRAVERAGRRAREAVGAAGEGGLLRPRKTPRRSPGLATRRRRGVVGRIPPRPGRIGGAVQRVWPTEAVRGPLKGGAARGGARLLGGRAHIVLAHAGRLSGAVDRAVQACRCKGARLSALT